MRRPCFLRRCAILLFFLVLVKIFLFDFPLLGDVARTVLLFFTGSVMVGLSVVYPGLKRAATKDVTRDA